MKMSNNCIPLLNGESCYKQYTLEEDVNNKLAMGKILLPLLLLLAYLSTATIILTPVQFAEEPVIDDSTTPLDGAIPPTDEESGTHSNGLVPPEED